MNDLLHDPILGVQTVNGTDRATLPQVLAWLSSGELLAYTGQRPHQADIWHVFTVQLAAEILARHPNVDSQNPPVEMRFWEDALLQLAGGQMTAWQFVVDDVTKPAFFQHPLADAAELAQAFKPTDPKASSPDEIDVLATAKNHDLKIARIPPSDLEAWIYALVDYQTTSGVFGQGNYGVIRMNSGTGTRTIVSMITDLAPSTRFREELGLVCEARANAILQCRYKNEGVVLTWLTPWNRSGHQFLRTELSPCFIEAARPLRMTRQKGGFVALGATSKMRQIGPKDPDGGDVGDPWTPIQTDNKKGRAALTVTGKGWDAKLLSDLLFRWGYEPTILQEPRKTGKSMWFIGTALARGQGKTEGFHRVELPVPPKALNWLAQPNRREKLAYRAQEFLKAANEVEKALHFGLMTLAEGGPQETDLKRDAVAKAVADAQRAFTQFWQARFFAGLWDALDDDDDTALNRWAAILRPAAERILDDAPNRLPVPSMRRYRGIWHSRGAFFGKLKKSGLMPEAPALEEEVVS